MDKAVVIFDKARTIAMRHGDTWTHLIFFEDYITIYCSKHGDKSIEAKIPLRDFLDALTTLADDSSQRVIGEDN